MSLQSYLPQARQLLIKQQREGIELLGFEGRNRYQILSPEGQVLATAEEAKQGMFKAAIRQILRHWRTFSFDVLDPQGQRILEVEHPFRFYFSRLEVMGRHGEIIGTMEKQFSILSKKFVITDNHGATMQMHAGFFKIWNYPITKNGHTIASVEKKWGGALREVFTDADTFLLDFKDPSLSVAEKQLLLSAALFIDVMYFDDNNGLNLTSFIPGFGE